MDDFSPEHLINTLTMDIRHLMLDFTEMIQHWHTNAGHLQTMVRDREEVCEIAHQLSYIPNGYEAYQHRYDEQCGRSALTITNLTTKQCHHAHRIFFYERRIARLATTRNILNNKHAHSWWADVADTSVVLDDGTTTTLDKALTKVRQFIDTAPYQEFLSGLPKSQESYDEEVPYAENV